MKKNKKCVKRFLCTKTLPISLIFLLLITGVVNSVWIYTDTTFYAGDFTFNTQNAQNFTYIAHNGTVPYTNYSYDGSIYYNNTYLTNFVSTETYLDLNTECSQGTSSTVISFDLFAPSTWTATVTGSVITDDDNTDSITLSYTQTNSTHRTYTGTYTLNSGFTSSDIGYADVNITATVQNNSLIYTGYYLSTDVFYIHIIDPPSSTSCGFNATYTSINSSWTIGSNADTTVVIRRNSSYADCPSDGYELQNNTDDTYNMTATVGETFYLTLFSYNTSTNSYSAGVDLAWGAIQFQCFNESNPNQALTFDVEISNSDASITYTAEDLTNGHDIDLDDIPYGDETVFIISSSGYRDRTYYYDLVKNQYYNHSYYLPPIVNVVDDEEDADNPPERRTKTDVSYVNDTSTNVTINTAYSIDDIIQVYQYNSSIYGGWISVPVDNYTATSNSVEVDHQIFDDNTTMIRVDYYYYHYDNTTETHLYFIKIIDESGEPINDAKVTVQRYMTSTDSYETVAIMYTGGYGYCSDDFIPSTLYRITGNKSGYSDSSAYWTTDPDNYGTSNPKIIQLALLTPNFINETTFNEAITFDATINDTGYINISYDDSLNETVSTSIHILENSSSWYYDNRTDSDSFSFTVAGNTSKTYEIILTVAHERFGTETMSTVLYLIGPLVPGRNLTNTSWFNDMFENVFGSNSLGWAAIFVQFIILGAVFSFGPRNSGIGSMLAGGLCLFINIILGITVLGTIIPILFIVFGIIRQWRMMSREAGS